MALYSRVRVGQKIRQIREERGLSQGKLAAALGLSKSSQSQVSLWESGKVLPDPKTIERIAQIFQIDVEAFVEDPPYAGRGVVGGVLIEVVERFGEHLPRDLVVTVLQQLVNEMTDYDGMSTEDHAAWDGYLRGAGLIKRGEEPLTAAADAAKAGRSVKDLPPAAPRRASGGPGGRRP